jgi:hypothetical protein
MSVRIASVPWQSSNHVIPYVSKTGIDIYHYIYLLGAAWSDICPHNHVVHGTYRAKSCPQYLKENVRIAS